MTYQDIYDTALRLVCEDSSAAAPDYDDRAPYLLANFYNEQVPLQKKLDAAKGAEPTDYQPEVCVDLGVDFPFSEELISPATYYLAAMLSLDENEELSDRLFDRYIDGVATVAMSLPASLHPIKDCYNCLK